MRLMSHICLFLLFLIAAGCCSLVSKSGDAKVFKCPQLIHERGTQLYQMELPAISLSQTGTHVLRVRNLPPYLKGLFKYDVSMIVPEREGGLPPSSERSVVWYDAKISITYRKLDGTEIFEQAYSLGTSDHGFSQSHYGWQVGWNIGAGPYHLDPVPVKDDSFDIIVVVEQPSKRASDKINISAYAICPKP
jgi:hypothetical protein